MIRAVLWDLDGTLVDSEEYHWLAWLRILEPEGLALTREQFLASFGQKNDRILRGWLGTDASPERIQRIGDAKEAEYRRLAQERGLVALPGAAEWVRRLHATGWKQAIASSAPAGNVEVMLDALGLTAFFDAVTAAEDVTAGKPDPQVFLTTAAKIGVPPARCIVVEDAAAGVEAARRAGMRCVGVSQSTPLPADVFVRSLADLADGAFDELLTSTQRRARDESAHPDQ